MLVKERRLSYLARVVLRERSKLISERAAAKTTIRIQRKEMHLCSSHLHNKISNGSHPRLNRRPPEGCQMHRQETTCKEMQSDTEPGENRSRQGAMNFASVAFITSFGTGFSRYSTIPTPKAASFHRLTAHAVCAIIGMYAVLGFSLSLLAASKPVMSGRPRSTMIKSGFSASTFWIASFPVAAPL
jgi:hypothetical protein